MRPVASMTGFAAATRATPLGTVTVELKSVNSRFLDLNLRVTDELRATEPLLRESIAAAIARGKLDCRVGLLRGVPEQPPVLNSAVLAQLKALSVQVHSVLPHTPPLALADVLNWPGAIEAPEVDTETVRQPVLAALDEALEALRLARSREGDALRRVLLERCDRIDAIVAELTAQQPAMLAALERKLTERLTQALTPALAGAAALSREEVNERIRQEVTLYGLRADVEEELKRLATHVTEVRRVLGAGGPVGRRLDFLMQELNREANTLGSKASATEQTNAAIELKLAIEQMREQIQNLE